MEGKSSRRVQMDSTRKQGQSYQSQTLLEKTKFTGRSKGFNLGKPSEQSRFVSHVIVEDDPSDTTTREPVDSARAARASKNFQKERDINRAKPLTPERKRKIEAEEAARKAKAENETTTAPIESTSSGPAVDDEVIGSPQRSPEEIAKARRKFKRQQMIDRAIPLTLKRKLEIEAEEAARRAREKPLTTPPPPETTTEFIAPTTTSLEDIPTTTLPTTTTPALKAIDAFFPPPPKGPSCTSAR